MSLLDASRRTLLVAALQILFGLQMGGYSEADVVSNTLPSSQIKLGSRVFDLRADVTEMRRDQTFIPMNDVDWIRDLLDSQPETSNVVFHIQRLNFPVLDHWRPLQDLRDMPVTSGFPEAYQVDGYLTFANGANFRDVLFFKEELASDFYVNCGGSNPTYSVFCGLRATYPPDPTIQIIGRIYFPKKPYRFEKIAKTLRKIAYCLDVTDRRDVLPPRLPNSRLLDEDCKYLPSS